LPLVPDLLWLDRERLVAVGQQALRQERDADRRRVADDFAQQADLVVEPGGRPDAAVEPRGVGRGAPHHRPGLALGDEPLVNRRPDELDPLRHERIVVVVERIAERRHEQHRPGRPGLVLVVHDLRVPLDELLSRDGLGLRLVVGVGVAVVVVAHVLLVEPGNVHRPLLRVGIAHVPVGDQLHPVRVDRGEEQDDVVQDAEGLGIAARRHLVGDLEEVLCGYDLRGVEAAVDPDDRLAFGGQLAGVLVGHPLGARQLLRDLLVAVELLLVLGRGEDRHDHRPAFGRPADVHQLHARRFLGQLLPVALQLRVVRQHVVVAGVEAEELLGRGDLRLRHDARGSEQGEQGQQRQGAPQRSRVHRGLLYEGGAYDISRTGKRKTENGRR
jgi:hypothetical protein